METEIKNGVAPVAEPTPASETVPEAAPEPAPASEAVPESVPEPVSDRGVDAVLEADRALPGVVAHRSETPGVKAQRDLLFGDMPCI